MANVHPLKTYRETHVPKLSQADLARKLGVGRPTVYRWEIGTRNIDEDLLPRVSQLTGIPAKELRPDAVEKYESIYEAEQAQ